MFGTCFTCVVVAIASRVKTVLIFANHTYRVTFRACQFWIFQRDQFSPSQLLLLLDRVRHLNELNAKSYHNLIVYLHMKIIKAYKSIWKITLRQINYLKYLIIYLPRKENQFLEQTIYCFFYQIRNVILNLLIASSTSF